MLLADFLLPVLQLEIRDAAIPPPDQPVQSPFAVTYALQPQYFVDALG